MRIGLYLPDVPGDCAELDHRQQDLGPALTLISLYHAWGSISRGFQPTALEALHRRGLQPLITWEPWRPPESADDPALQPRFSLGSILDGRHDPYIRSWAVACRDYGHRILLRPMHEMNGDWYPWCGTVNGNTPEQYVRAWRHVYAIFREVGTPYVDWVWCPYVRSYPDLPENQLERYFPGDGFVDWIGLDGYNWGTRAGEHCWERFEALFAPAYETLTRLSSRPVMIAEVASAEEGGSKAAWVEEMFQVLDERFPRVKALIWFDCNKERDWRTDSSPAVRAAFARAARAHSSTPGR